MRHLQVVSLKDEELETLFLADVKEMEHEAAAVLMGISRSTFSRILAQARKAVATALVKGAALRIEGDDNFLDRQERPTETGKE